MKKNDRRDKYRKKKYTPQKKSTQDYCSKNLLNYYQKKYKQSLKSLTRRLDIPFVFYDPVVGKRYKDVKSLLRQLASVQVLLTLGFMISGTPLRLTLSWPEWTLPP